MRRYAKARHKPGEMNKLEQEYANHLELLRRAGEIKSWEYEKIKLRLADKTFYTPDFMVVASDDTIEMHETKGFWEEDARVKIKVAAAMYPFRFLGVKKAPKSQGGWLYEEF
ncbi:MAG: DUF1064 domain-containing protein [Silanimonas sp.]